MRRLAAAARISSRTSLVRTVYTTGLVGLWQVVLGFISNAWTAAQPPAGAGADGIAGASMMSGALKSTGTTR